MNLQGIIQSGYKASIVECGHGAELANAFLSQPGASQFVMNCSQPYSKEIQRDMYNFPNIENVRSVSKEFVANVAKQDIKYIKQFSDSTKHISIVTSFQLDDGAGLTHGYMAIVKQGDKRLYTASEGLVYHFSFYRDKIHDIHTRKTTWINTIKTELLNVIYCNILKRDIDSNHIDGIWNFDVEQLNNMDHGYMKNILETLKVNQQVLSDKSKENFLCFARVGGIKRFEDVIRENKGEKRGIILQKGSFNPFHRMHKKIADDAKSAYPDYPHVLMLSLNTCDKGNNDEKVLLKRIEALTKIGYTVIVSKSGMFIENVKKIKEHYPDLNIVFPVGEDTMERFFRDWEDHFGKHVPHKAMRHTSYKFDFKNVEWYISKRQSNTKEFAPLIPVYQAHLDNFKYSNLDMDDISSTTIRNGEIENKL